MAGIKKGGIKKGGGYKKATVSSPAKKKAAYIKRRASSSKTISGASKKGRTKARTIGGGRASIGKNHSWSNASRKKAAAGSFKKPNGAAGRPLSAKFKALSITQDRDQKIQSF